MAVRPIEVLTEAEVRLLINACSQAPTGLRNRALLMVMYVGALRITEALALKVGDIDWATGATTVRLGKGAKRRVVGLDDAALSVAALWRAKRTELGINGHAVLFCTLKGAPVKTAYVRNLMRRLAKKIDLNKRCHPHQLRHSRAAALESQGMKVSTIQDALGHGKLATTEIYLKHLTGSDVVEAMRAVPFSLDEPAPDQRQVERRVVAQQVPAERRTKERRKWYDPRGGGDALDRIKKAQEGGN